MVTLGVAVPGAVLAQDLAPSGNGGASIRSGPSASPPGAEGGAVDDFDQGPDSIHVYGGVPAATASPGPDTGASAVAPTESAPSAESASVPPPAAPPVASSQPAPSIPAETAPVTATTVPPAGPPVATSQPEPSIPTETAPVAATAPALAPMAPEAAPSPTAGAPAEVRVEPTTKSLP